MWTRARSRAQRGDDGGERGCVTQVGNLLHGKEKVVFGDAGYIGAGKQATATRGRKWHIAAKRSKGKAIEDETLRDLTEQIEHIKASIRVAVEHPFRVVKRQFGHVKARYRGFGQERCAAADVVCVEQPVDDPRVSAGKDRIGAPEVRIAAAKRRKMGRNIAIGWRSRASRTRPGDPRECCGYERGLIRSSLAGNCPDDRRTGIRWRVTLRATCSISCDYSGLAREP